MTGSRGPVSKPDHARQRRNRRSDLILAGDGLKPSASKDLLAVTRAQWTTFWSGDIGKTMRAEHMPIVERLFYRYDERERAIRVIRKDGRLTEGSQGQMVLHPLIKLIDSCDSEIRQLEDRLGLSPRSRVELGGKAAKAQSSLDEMNRRMQADEEDEADEKDPRVVATISR